MAQKLRSFSVLNERIILKESVILVFPERAIHMLH